MKFNWGTGIIIAFIAFISFIMYFIVQMNIDKTYDHELVTENYYGQELKFQTDINAEIHSQSLEQDLTWRRSPKGILIEFPENIQVNNIKGRVFLYRPSDKNLDFETPISLTDHSLLIPDKRLLDGRWNLRVEWHVNDHSYLYKKEITY